MIVCNSCNEKLAEWSIFCKNCWQRINSNNINSETDISGTNKNWNWEINKQYDQSPQLSGSSVDILMWSNNSWTQIWVVEGGVTYNIKNTFEKLKYKNEYILYDNWKDFIISNFRILYSEKNYSDNSLSLYSAILSYIVYIRSYSITPSKPWFIIIVLLIIILWIFIISFIIDESYFRINIFSVFIWFIIFSMFIRPKINKIWIFFLWGPFIEYWWTKEEIKEIYLQLNEAIKDIVLSNNK